MHPIRDISEDPKQKASVVVGNFTRHDGFEGIVDGHDGSRHRMSLGSQYDAIDDSLSLLFRQREVVYAGIPFSGKIDDGSRRLDFGSGIKPARVWRIAHRGVVEVDTQVVLTGANDAQFESTVGVGHAAVYVDALGGAKLYSH